MKMETYSLGRDWLFFGIHGLGVTTIHSSIGKLPRVIKLSLQLLLVTVEDE